MNENQIKNELAKRKTDLAWWSEKLTHSRKAGKIGICHAQISWHRERISQLKRMRFDLLVNFFETADMQGLREREDKSTRKS